MSVYHSKSRGSWYVRISVKGRSYYCYSSPSGPFSKRSEAAAYESVFASLIVGSSSLEGASPLLSSYRGLFQDSLEARMKPSGVYTRMGLYGLYVAPFFEGYRVSDMSADLLERYNSWLNKSAPRGSLGPSVSLARVWLRFVHRWAPASDPGLVFAFLDATPRERVYRVWSLDQEKAFLSSIKDKRDLLLFTLLVYYGLRVGELLALKGSDFSGGSFSVRRALCAKSLTGRQTFTTPKTRNSLRALPVVRVLEPLVRKLPKGWLFPSYYKGVPVLGETTVRRLNRYYCRKAGLGDPLKIHEFRHSCASNLLRAGISVRIVARWLGDTEATIEATYSHLLPDEKDVIRDFFDSKV